MYSWCLTSSRQKSYSQISLPIAVFLLYSRFVQVYLILKLIKMRPLLQGLFGNRAASLTLAASVPFVGGSAYLINSRSFFGTAKAATNLPRVFFDVKVS